jgi:hypothetical protein
MTFTDLVQFYFDRSNALQWYWTIYVLVIGGMLAFSSLRRARDLVTTLLITVLFCCFAYKNLGAIHDVTLQRYAILQAIKDTTPTGVNDIRSAREFLEPTLVAPAYEGVRNFHVASDVLTILALWAMERRRRESPKN